MTISPLLSEIYGMPNMRLVLSVMCFPTHFLINQHSYVLLIE